MNDSGNTPSDDSARRKRLRLRWLTGLLVLCVAAGLAYGGYWYFITRFYVSTEDAYVHGNRITLMPRVQGSVERIVAEDTDYVTRGQPLIQLDDNDAQVALEQAKANLAQTLRQVQSLYVQVAQQEAVIDQRQSESAQTQRDFERARTLYERDSISQERFQQARTEAESAQASLRAARRQLDALRARTHGTEPARHPRVLGAIQQLRQAWLDLRHTSVVAPVSGHVATRSVQLGQQVSPGTPLLSIVPLEQVWAEANFKETDLLRVRIGQPVEIHADFYGDEVAYDGRVAGLSAGTGSAFELLPPQNATGNWIKVVQRVPVRIVLDPGQLEEHPLRIGLSLTATIDVHDLDGASLASEVRRDDRYTTPVYRLDPAPLNELVETIIQNNLTIAESRDTTDG